MVIQYQMYVILIPCMKEKMRSQIDSNLTFITTFQVWLKKMFKSNLAIRTAKCYI